MSRFFVLEAEWDYIIAGAATRPQMKALRKALEESVSEGAYSHPAEDFFLEIIAAISMRFPDEDITKEEEHTKVSTEPPQTEEVEYKEVEYKGKSIAERRLEAKNITGREWRGAKGQ